MTKQQIEAHIQEICDTLKGPNVSDLERLLLNEDRKDLRATLATMATTVRPGADDGHR